MMFLQSVIDKPDRLIYKTFYLKTFRYIFSFKLADGTVVPEDTEECVQRINPDFSAINDLVIFKDKILSAIVTDKTDSDVVQFQLFF